jgi:endonuclease III
VTLEEKALEVYCILLSTYGERDLIPRREPMHELVSTILSQRTNWKNEELAYRRMWERFGSWEAIRDAPTDELARAIAPSNFAEAKAPQIQKTVATILELRGDTDLGFLRDLSVEEGVAWLTALPGVGIKTASLVLLFCFAKPILPVDTHVYRVSQRLGLLSAKVKTSTAAHAPLFKLLPHEPHFLYNFHVACLLHGQQLCTFNAPRCGRCPLTEHCDYFRERAAPARA